MKAFFVFCVLLFAAAVFFFAGQDSVSKHKPDAIAASSDGQRTQQEQPEVPVVRPLQVSAPGLFNAYQRNEVAADNAYKGKLLAVQGIVSSIQKDFTEQIYVELVSPNEFMDVRAFMDDGNEARAASLQKAR